MAKTCIRVEACNIGSSERHNLRSKELDYIRPELTHRNEQWVIQQTNNYPLLGKISSSK